MKRNNLKRFIIVVTCMFIIQAGRSQKNFIPGYIINNKLDTIRGYIDYREWSVNPKVILFKTELTEKAVECTPLGIVGFNVSDETYESGIVKTEISSREIGNLDKKANLSFATDTVFLQAVFTGSKKLFFYKDNILNDHLYIKDTTYELLIYKPYLKKDSWGNNIFHENNTYKGQLINYFKDSPELKSKIEDIKYDKRSIEEVFKKYYDNNKSEISFYKETESIKLEYGFLAGVNLTNFVYAMPNKTVLRVNSTSKEFTASVFVNIILPRNHGKWSICNELNYSEYNGLGTITNNDIPFGFSVLKYNILGRYTYPLNKLRIYSNIGFSYGRIFNNIYDSTFYNFNRKYELGPLLGMGVSLKKFLFEFRYEYQAGYSDYNYLVFYTDTYYFLLGYKF